MARAWCGSANANVLASLASYALPLLSMAWFCHYSVKYIPSELVQGPLVLEVLFTCTFLLLALYTLQKTKLNNSIFVNNGVILNVVPLYRLYITATYVYDI